MQVEQVSLVLVHRGAWAHLLEEVVLLDNGKVLILTCHQDLEHHYLSIAVVVNLALNELLLCLDCQMRQLRGSWRGLILDLRRQ